MLYYTDEEIRNKVNKVISDIETPIQVIFEDVQCQDCGVVGDKRLLPDYCHMEKIYQHPLPLKHYHPKELT